MVGMGTPILERNNLSGTKDNYIDFSVNVPSGAKNVMFSVIGENVGLTIAVPGSTNPFSGLETCDWNFPSSTICYVENPTPGNWTASISPLDDYSGVTFIAERDLPDLPE